MKCTQCGQEITAQEENCPNCGAGVSQQYQNFTNQFDDKNTNYTQDAPVYPPVQQSSGMAISSMVLGIVSLLLSCIALGWITAIISLVQGIIVLANDKPGKGMAISGIVMSAVTLLFSIIAVLLVGYGASLY